METLSGEEMKISVGDLFLISNNILFLLTKIEPNGMMLGYMSNEHPIPYEVGFAWLFNIEEHIKKDSWKHYPVKE